LQEEDSRVVDQLEAGRLDTADVDEPQRRLLDFVRQLTLKPAGTTDEQVAGLREAGWRDEQIAEAVYVTALFAFFNRVADGFGLRSPGYRADGPS